MTDFSIRSDSVNVEEIMGQIRARIREKRGVDYTEQEIRELAAAKLEKFLDPATVRSDLLKQYQQLRQHQAGADSPLDEETLFGSPKPWVRRIRRLLRPVLKLFLNPVPLMRASRVNETMVRHAELFYEIVHNLVVETTRLSIEVKNLKMRVESLSSRLDFDERRSRALEGVVQYRPASPSQTTAAPQKEEEESGTETEGGASRSRRRRRRRGRRGGGQRPTPEEMAGTGPGAQPGGEEEAEAPTTEGASPNRSVQESVVGQAAAEASESRSPGHDEQPSPAREESPAPAAPIRPEPRHETGHAQEREPGDRESGS